MRKIFTHKYSGIVVLLLAFLVKAMLLRWYLKMDGDRSLQMIGAISWLDGNSYSIPEVELSNLNRVVYHWLPEWPPLYSAMLVPVLWITGMDQVLASTIMDSLGAFLYLFAIWRLARYCQFPPLLQYLMLGFAATGFNEAILFSMPTDFWAAGAMLMAVYSFLNYFENRSGWLLGYWVFWGVAACYFRYMYLPAVILLPAILMYNGWKGRERNLLVDGTLAGFVTLVLCSLNFFLNSLYSGSLTYLENWPTAFDPLRAIGITPIFWEAFMHLVFVCIQLSHLFKVDYSLVHSWFYYSSVIILLAMLLFWSAKSYQRKWLMPLLPFDRFAYVMVAPCLGLLALLMYLSARISFDPGLNELTAWTYVSEDRYFLFHQVLVLFVIAQWAFVSKGSEMVFRKMVQWALVAAMFIQLVHIGWLFARNNSQLQRQNIFYSRYTGNGRKMLDRFRDAAARKGLEPVVFANDYSVLYHAISNDMKVYRKLPALDGNTQLACEKKSLLIYVVTSKLSGANAAFLERNGFRGVKISGEDFSYYIALGKPSN